MEKGKGEEGRGKREKGIGNGKRKERRREGK